MVRDDQESCPICRKPMPCGSTGTICPECQRNSLQPILDSDDDPDVEFDIHADPEPDPDDFAEVEEDDPPDEDDLLTEDCVQFFRKDFEHHGPVLVVSEDADRRREVKRFMLREQWYPNVWLVSDHGNFHLLSLNKEN